MAMAEPMRLLSLSDVSDHQKGEAGTVMSRNMIKERGAVTRQRLVAMEESRRGCAGKAVCGG
jgi:hypothetical protein